MVDVEGFDVTSAANKVDLIDSLMQEEAKLQERACMIYNCNCGC